MFAVCTTALLLILAFPPFDQGWIAWIALIPWLFELERSGPRRAFLLSYLAGFLFFLGTVWWVGHVTIPGAAVLIAYLALFFAAWGWLSNRVFKTGGAFLSLLLLPASWVALEYARSHLLTGLGWNLLAHTQWNWIPIIQIASFTGVWGVSFLIVLINVGLWRAVQSRSLRPIGLPALCLGLVWCLGYFGQPVTSLEEKLRVALLQGNIPQGEKWDEAFQESIWKRYEQLTAQAAARQPDLIVWPETAVPGYLEELLIEDRLKEICAAAGTPMLVGVPTEDFKTGLPYNSAVLLTPAGEELGRYSKIHLVPFGEFMPIQPVFGWLKKFYPIADFSPGSRFTVFRTRPPVSVLVCFEDLFPELTRRFVKEGAGWLLVITNDAWFGRSAASLQHLQASVFRAVENRVWIGRSANNGWTGFVDPTDRRLPPPGQIPRFKAGVATADLWVSPWPPTLYTRWGDWFPLLCLGLAVWAIMGIPHLRWKASSS